jgi:hypothetical protein
MAQAMCREANTLGVSLIKLRMYTENLLLDLTRRFMENDWTDQEITDFFVGEGFPTDRIESLLGRARA